MRSELLVHYLDTLDPHELADLTSQLDSRIRLTYGPEVTQQAHYQILIAGRPARQHLTASPALQALVIPWAGVPEPTRQLAVDFPQLTVHNLHHNAAPTAELGLALLFSAAKLILPFDQALRQGDWQARYQPSPAMLLAGKNVLLLGLGTIGQRIARVCQALEMQVFAVRRHTGRDAPGLEHVRVYPPESTPELLADCQVLIIALPLTPETRGLIGAEELERMPDQSILVNIGRGAIIDQVALYRSLVKGKLAAAGLDVWYNYPNTPEARSHTLPSDVPLYSLKNVVLSPHRGGASRDTESLRMRHLAALLNAAARGEPLPNQVDLKLGY